jgi:hypothetical protein
MANRSGMVDGACYATPETIIVNQKSPLSFEDLDDMFTFDPLPRPGSGRIVRFRTPANVIIA